MAVTRFTFPRILALLKQAFQGVPDSGGPRPVPVSGTRRRFLPVLLIAVVTLASFSMTLRNGFVLDDVPFVVHNPALESLRNVPHIFLSDDAVGSGMHNPYYRPLTTLTFALDRFLHGTDPLGYHATNLLLHIAVSVLLYLVARRIAAKPEAAFLAALLFAIHPANAEPVAYISARADLMCGLGLTASLLMHLRWRETGSRTELALSIAAFAFAAFSKCIAIAFPVLLAFHAALLVRGERRWKAAILPYVAVAAVYLVVRNSVVVMKIWEGYASFEVRISNLGVFLASYLRNALFPLGLRLFYDLPIRTYFFEPSVLSSWSIITAIALLAVSAARRHPVAVFGITWFFACLLPVSGIFGILYPAAMADRYMYAPLIGLAIASTPLFDRIPIETIRLRALSPLAVILLILAGGMAITTASRVTAWRDTLTYWKTADSEDPGSIPILVGIGSAYKEKGRLEEAEQMLERAIDVWDGIPATRIMLAEIDMAFKNYPGAERHLFRALEIKPGDPQALTLLGDIFARTGRIEEAREFREEASRGAP
ncbi:MAG: tetratricopeptide repeat protein [bacterium]|jgi:tetratricopeptide (TPR) repeat protein